MKKDEKLTPELTAKREYFKNWRKNNKDKVKKYNEKFWKKQVEKLNNK
ncbi:MAG: hypothetical protein IJ068_00250 [Bacilli bacterium]|nr:hypothetical protein [Bacilli bacterium]